MTSITKKGSRMSSEQDSESPPYMRYSSSNVKGILKTSSAENQFTSCTQQPALRAVALVRLELLELQGVVIDWSSADLTSVTAQSSCMPGMVWSMMSRQDTRTRPTMKR